MALAWPAHPQGDIKEKKEWRDRRGERVHGEGEEKGGNMSKREINWRKQKRGKKSAVGIAEFLSFTTIILMSSERKARAERRGPLHSSFEI